MVLAVRTLNRLRWVQDPHQEGRLLCLSAARVGGPEFPDAVPVVLGGAKSILTDGDGTKHRSHHERYGHRIQPTDSHIFPPP